MKQLLQNIKTGKSTVEDVPMPTPREGRHLSKIEASLVSAGTERMVVEFAEKIPCWQGAFPSRSRQAGY